MNHSFRKLIGMTARVLLSRNQIESLRKTYSRFRERSINKNVKQEVIPKLEKLSTFINNNEESLLQDTINRIVAFMDRLKIPGKDFHYLYSEKSKQPTIYASAYACMTLSLLGRLHVMPSDQKLRWMEYFNGYQNEADGLFYDPVIDTELFRTGDWWGARHLALHMVSAYTDLGGRPRYPFHFLEEYYDHRHLKNWLDRVDWSSAISHDDDIDNQIMNVGCLLQYQRDTWNDEQAGAAVAYLQKYLLDKINPETGMWGGYDPQDPDQRSRMVQFAYHLFTIFFYDRISIPYPDKVVDLVLMTQNELGGFGVKLNSSACEDMDSIYILIRIAPMVPNRKVEIDIALKKALLWVLCNQVDDGGFVFRLEEPLVYGHPEMSSEKNQGAMFSTWFRTLSLAYLARYFSIELFHITSSAPGLEN